MRFTKLPALALAPLALSAILAGCGSSSDDPNGSELPLEERIFASRQGDPAEHQRLIAECMVKQGFEYTPMDGRDTGGPPERMDPRSEEYIKEFGFGVSTMFASEIRFSAPTDDPNAAYRNSLDETQKAAYDKALYGFELGGPGGFSTVGGGAVVAIPIAGGSIGGDNEGAPTVTGPGGCIGEALKATGADQRPFDTSLFDDLEELEDRIKADPEMVQAMKKWSACMKDAGYEYRNVDDAIDQLREEFGELTGLKTDGDGGFRITISAESSGGSEGTRTFDPLANVDKEKLGQLQAKEKTIAMAAFECAEDDLLKVERKVRERFEEEFLEDHPELKAED